MERRKQSRHPVCLYAVVTCPRFGLFRGAVENLSADGVYVRTRNVNMCIDVPVTLTLQGGEGAQQTCCEVSGVVVHQDAEGFGVRFADVEESCIRRLRELLAEDATPVDGREALLAAS
ncbi:PilZ domain-containing protein [endosymbiont of unidentified scaly snail isolate Monju]|uniref:PilZ domain-containing protein n=1 Tax=endosymbiont of unidentified scaly snail isolate Monju TaxID=1248727 RepID=UPI0003892155|nr:PilZ domain-containing protein [endosymbiont of unidentified scaly snail isolate Monju]BAN69359.1 hypothetical protein EBS_1473 [endosymbiont of unidentified scaly snail isolate Monju]